VTALPRNYRRPQTLLLALISTASSREQTPTTLTTSRVSSTRFTAKPASAKPRFSINSSQLSSTQRTSHTKTKTSNSPPHSPPDKSSISLLEDSLYQLERPGDDINRLNQVIDYFQTHVAPRQGQKFILLDDVQALALDENRKAELLNLIDDNTYVFLTGNVRAQVNLSTVETADTVDEFEGPWPILPMKFIDTVQTGEGLGVTFTEKFRTQLEQFQSPDLDGPSPIKTIRTGLSGKNRKPVSTQLLRHSQTSASAFLTRATETTSMTPRAHTSEQAAPSTKQTTLRSGTTSQNPISSSSSTKNSPSTDPSNNPKTSTDSVPSLPPTPVKNSSTPISATKSASTGEPSTTTSTCSTKASPSPNPTTTPCDATAAPACTSATHATSSLLSQRQEHHGFEAYERQDTLNHEFEYKLARTVAFDHAKRLAFTVEAYDVEYTETESGLVDYILHRNGHVLPFISPTTRTLATPKQSPKNSPPNPASTPNPTAKCYKSSTTKHRTGSSLPTACQRKPEKTNP